MIAVDESTRKSRNNKIFEKLKAIYGGILNVIEGLVNISHINNVNLKELRTIIKSKQRLLGVTSRYLMLSLEYA